MTALAFDIYPASDPVAGARLARLEADDYLDGTEYRRVLRGTGAGRIVIHSLHAAVVAGHLSADNYVRVVDLGYNQVVGGFWLMEGEEVVLSRVEEGGEIRSYGGPGTLHYLSRATLPVIVRSTGAGPNDQFYIDTEGDWIWGSAGSETYGGILRRILVEALLDVPTAIPDRGAIGWDDLIDSSGASWTTFTGEYRIRVGTNLLDAVLDLMRKGIDVVMDPDTFDLEAYLVGNYGVDRTSATFATGKVRFQGGVNIASDLTKAIHRLPYVSHVLVIGSDGVTEGEVVDPDWTTGDIVYRDTLRLDNTVDALVMQDAGEEFIRERKLRADQATFPILPGADPLTGLYAAGIHFLPGDLVTLHTGTGTHDYNNQAIECAAIEWRQITDNGEFTPVVELGSQYIDSRTAAELQRLGTVIRNGGHSHPPNPRLCRQPSVPNLYAAAIGTSMPDPVTIGTGVTGETGRSLYALVYVSHPTSPGISAVTYSTTADHTSAPSFTLVESQEADASNQGILNLYRLDNPAAGTATASVKATITGDGAIGVFYADSATIRDFVVAVGSGTSSSVTIAGQEGDLRLDLGGWQAANASPVDAPTPGAGQTSQGTSTRDQSFGQPDFGAGISSSTLNTVTWSWAAARPWYAGIIALVGEAGDTPQPVGGNSEGAVSTSTRASRCGHVHPHGDLSAKTTETHHHAQSVKFTPTGTVAATNVQAAIAEVAAEATGIPASIVDAKGDLIVGTAADTVARLAAPANGGRWVADSAQSSGWRSVLDKYDATAAPTVTDDSAAGYSIGSKWVDVTNDHEYVALDVTAGAAVWKQTTAAGGSGSLTVQDEGTPLATAADTLNFTGAGVTASGTGGTKTINIPGGSASSKYSPDNAPATAPAVSDEFDDASFTGWSWDSTPATVSETTYPGFLYVDGDGTERHLNRAWTPGAVDITLAAKIITTEIPGGEASTGLGIYLGDTTGNPANSVLWQLESNGAFVAYNENGAGAFTSLFTTAVLLPDLVHGEFYLMIQRTNTGPVWRFYWSRTGLPASWHRFATTGAKALTIGAFGIRADTDGQWAVDWIRAWASLVDKVGS